MNTRVDYVLPTYKKFTTLHPLLERLKSHFDESKNVDSRAIFVLDGPDQDSEDLLMSACDDRIVVTKLPVNTGKGSAIRAAIPLIQSEIVVIIDADLDIDIKGSVRGIELLLLDSENAIGCVYGSKFHPESSVQYPAIRRALSWGFRRFSKTFFNLDVDDTQTGLKVLRSNVFESIGRQCSEERFLFDVELMTWISRAGLKLVSTPVTITHQFNSTIKPRVVIEMVRDAVLLAFRLSRPRPQIVMV